MFGRAIASCGMVAALMLAAAGLAPASALADGYVQINPVNVGTNYVPPLDLSDPSSRVPSGSMLGQPDVTNGSYRVTEPDGTQRTVPVANGYSLAKLLGDFGYNSPFGFAEVQAPDLYAYLLPSGEATSTSSDPPVVWYDGTSVHFADANGDYVTQPNTIAINLHSGTILNVSIHSSANKVPTGKPIDFTSSVSPLLSGLKYLWYLGDGGKDPTGPAPTHTYRSPGQNINVYLRVTNAASDSLGFSGKLVIKVGKAHKAPPRTGGGTPRTGADNGPGTKGNGGRGGAGATGTGANNTPGSGTSAKQGATNAAKHPPGPKPSPPGPAPQNGQLVAGIPVTGAPQAAGSPSTAGVPDPARSGQVVTHHGFSLGWGFWVVLGALAMLTTGALLEAYGPPPFPPRLRVTIARAR